MGNATILQQQTIADAQMNWSQTVPFQQFDPSQGTLLSINIGLIAGMHGDVSVENLEAAPAAISIAQLGDISVSDPAGLQLADDPLAASADATLGAFDGTIDYAGPSGTIVPLSASGTADMTLSGTGSDFAPFIGTRSVPLSAYTGSAVDVTGPANMQIASQATAGATIDLKYDYATTTAGTSGGGDDGDVTTIITPTLDFEIGGAVTTVPQVLTVADSTTGWSDELAVNQFNPALGTLEAVNVTLSGDLSTSVAAENEDPNAATVWVTQAATLTLALPGMTETNAGATTTTEALSSYDGTADFAGTSGTIEQSQTTIAPIVNGLDDPTDLPAFTGTGTVEATLSSSSSADLQGPGNLLAKLLAEAGGTIAVSYVYLPNGVSSDAIDWEGYGSDDWTRAADWSSYPSVPGPTDDVVIGQPGTYTITLSAAETIHSIVIDAPGATLLLDANLIATGTVFLDAGTIDFNGGSISAGDITMNGGVMVGESIDLQSSGTISLNAGSVVAADSVTVSADGGSIVGGSMSAGDITMNGGVVVAKSVDVQSSGTLSLNAGSVVAGNSATLSAEGGSLVTGPTAVSVGSLVGSLVTDGSIVPAGFVTTETNAECFALGTRITTPHGEVAVEDLTVGDLVLLSSGATAPIVWIGYREIKCRRQPKPQDVWPIRVRRGAFGDDQPRRDLYLSPDHAVFVDGALIPVKYLRNGSSIRQIRRDSVRYFHVELPRHDVVLAEGLAVETYLDVGNRGNFANNPGPVALYPDFVSLTWEAEGYAPLVVTGPVLDAVRRRLDAREAARATKQARRTAWRYRPVIARSKATKQSRA